MSSILFGCFVGRSLYHFALFDTSSASCIGVMIKRYLTGKKVEISNCKFFTTRAQIKYYHPYYEK